MNISTWWLFFCQKWFDDEKVHCNWKGVCSFFSPHLFSLVCGWITLLDCGCLNIVNRQETGYFLFSLGLLKSMKGLIGCRSNSLALFLLYIVTCNFNLLKFSLTMVSGNKYNVGLDNTSWLTFQIIEKYIKHYVR